MMVLIHTVVSWLSLWSLALAIAILFFRLPAFLPSAYAPYRPEPIGPSVRPLFAILVVLIAAASLGDLVLRASEMTGRGIPDALGVLSVVVQRTHYGTTWLVRAAASVLLIMLTLFSWEGRKGTALRVVMLALAVVIAWTFSASGHASDQGDFTLQEMMDLLHLLASSLWGGGVLVLALVILPSLLARGDLLNLAEVSRRFSRVAGFAVLVLLLAALYNVRVYVGEFKALWTTGYGLTVVAKMILLYFLLLIGAFNRYVSLPFLLHVAGGRLEPPGAVGRVIGLLLDRFRQHLTAPVTLIFRKALLIEAVLMAAVLLAAAALKHQTPASHLRHGEQQHIEQTTLSVRTEPGVCAEERARTSIRKELQ